MADIHLTPAEAGILHEALIHAAPAYDVIWRAVLERVIRDARAIELEGMREIWPGGEVVSPAL